jgi:hypothetical protein
MPRILTTNAIITCPHGGRGNSISLDPIWQINGGSVLAEGDSGTLDCTFQIPCTSYTLRSMGLNATMLNGRKVILESDFNRTITGLPLTIIETHQVIDNSVPVPLPTGEDAPPLPPELLDSVPPVVVPASRELTYPTTPTPAPFARTSFALSTTFPNRWILTLLNTNASSALDLTAGLPPQVMVLPAGGNWTSPELTVTVTLTMAFMLALGAGTHNLYMTAISRRGLSSHAATDLLIT